MKKIICLQILLLTFYSSFSQLIASFEKDTISVERDKSVDQIFHLSVKITGFNLQGGAANTINFTINPTPLTTMSSSDYSFAVVPINVSIGIALIDCPITIMHGENAGANTLFVSIQMSYNSPAIQVKNSVLKITNKEDEAKSKKKNKLEIGAISIGHSFDFFGKDNALISYADVYVFRPNSFSIGKNPKEEKYGFAVKLYQNKSLTTDSLNTNGSIYKLINQTLVNPLQPPVNDSVFLKQEVLSRKSSYKSNNWGMYIRLFRDISYINKKTKFYLGLHGEFLRRNIETTYEYKSEKDTILKIKSNQIPYSGAAPLSKNSIQSEFYLAPYIEFLHSNDDISVHFSIIPAGLNVYRQTILNNTTFNKFFFMGQFDLILNELNIKLGAECRGLYNVKSQPYWNVFISKSFSWSKLKDLIL